MAYFFYVAASSLLLISAQEQYVLAGTDVYFDSLAYSLDQFSAPLNGEIIGAQFVHKSGRVTCNINGNNGVPASLWGCSASGGAFFIELVQLPDGPINGSTLYPTPTTEGVSGLKLLGCETDEVTWTCTVQFYDLADYSASADPTFEMRDESNVNTVHTYNRFSIQYGEGCCDVARPDNLGNGTADVYFIYSNIFTDEPTNNPSSDPTMGPTETSESPSTSPTKNPTTSPSRQPTRSPTPIPSSQPSNSPSKDPTTSPLLSGNPTMHPTVEPTMLPSLEPTMLPSASDEGGEVDVTDETSDDENVDVESDETESGGFVDSALNGETEMWIVIAAFAALLVMIAVVGFVCYKRSKHYRKTTTNMGYDDWA